MIQAEAQAVPTSLIAMPLNIKQMEETAYGRIQLMPFTCINGQPTQSNYKLLKRKCSERASKIKDVVFPWCMDYTTGKEYGLLANILGRNEYTT
jgi:hypothetical protein